MNKRKEIKKNLDVDSEENQTAQDEETDQQPIGKILGTWKTSCSMEAVMIRIVMKEVPLDGGGELG